MVNSQDHELSGTRDTGHDYSRPGPGVAAAVDDHERALHFAAQDATIELPITHQQRTAGGRI